ncbi:MAG: hypothetical protein ACRC4X_05405 [Cetobacterium sp.]
MPKNLVITTDKEFGEMFSASHDASWYSSYQDAIIPLGGAVTSKQPINIIYLDTNFDDFSSTVAHVGKISPNTVVHALVSGEKETINEISADPTALQLDYVKGELERVRQANSVHPPVASNAPIIVKVGDGLVRSWDAFLDTNQGRATTVLVSLVALGFITIMMGAIALIGIQVYDFIKSPSQRHDINIEEGNVPNG